MENSEIISIARRTIQQEAQSIKNLADFINEDFSKVISLLNDCKGRVVVSGIGKSAIVAQKIVATLNSTGTPSIFMHAADAIHGDIGMVRPEDVVIIVSKSGDSPEIKTLVPLVKNFGSPLIAMVGQIKSFLAQQADGLLNTTIAEEACPNNLAPTTSTTAQMVMGDAVAICLMEARGFGAGEFARFHPGGTLGKKLYLKVWDLCLQNEKPSVNVNSSLREVIIEITKKRLGAAVVLDKNETIQGIVTDGDLRRMLEKNLPLEGVKAEDIMSTNPKRISPDSLATEALEKMQYNKINHLLVVENNKYVGIIHLHDLVKEGII